MSKTIPLYENDNGTQHDRGVYDVPEFFENFRLPDRISVHQVVALDDIATSDNPEAELQTLRDAGLLGRGNDVTKVIDAYMTNRNSGEKASFGQRALLRTMVIALMTAKGISAEDVQFFVGDAKQALRSKDLNETREAISDLRGTIIAFQGKPGVHIDFDPDRRPTDDTVPTSEEPPFVEEPAL